MRAPLRYFLAVATAWFADLWAIDAHGALVHDRHGDSETEAINDAILGSLV